MKQSDVIEKAKINALARVSERVKVRQLTEYGQDNRTVFNALMDMLHVGYANMGGIEYRVTCQARH